MLSYEYALSKILESWGGQMKIFWVQIVPFECPNNKSLNGIKVLYENVCACLGTFKGLNLNISVIRPGSADGFHKNASVIRQRSLRSGIRRLSSGEQHLSGSLSVSLSLFPEVGAELLLPPSAEAFPDAGEVARIGKVVPLPRK